jgi:hypothetical protein
LLEVGATSDRISAFEHWNTDRALGGRWPALDSCPVFRGVDGSIATVWSSPARLAFKELVGPEANPDEVRAASDVVVFLLRALRMGSPKDREKIRRLRDEVEGLPERRAAAVWQLEDAIRMFGAPDPEGVPVARVRLKLDLLNFRRAHAFAGSVQAGHDMIDRALVAAATAQRAAPHQHPTSLPRAAAAELIVRFGAQDASRESIDAIIAERALEDNELRTIAASERWERYVAAMTIEALERLDPRCLALEYRTVHDLIRRAARTKAKGTRGAASLKIFGLGGKLLVPVGAFGFGVKGDFATERDRQTALTRAERNAADLLEVAVKATAGQRC